MIKRTDPRGGVSARYNNLNTALLLLRTMARTSISYIEAEEMGIHRRNFYRYIAAMKRAGLNVRKQRLKGGHYHYWISRQDWVDLLN